MSSSTTSYLSAAIIGSKVGSMFGMIVMAIIGALIPLLLGKFKMNHTKNFLNAVAGGAFLSLGLFHILPDAVTELEESKLILYINTDQFNLAYVFVFLGYIIILFAEYVLFYSASKEIMNQDQGIYAHHHSPSALVIISSKCNNIKDEHGKYDKELTNECFLSDITRCNYKMNDISKGDDLEDIQIDNSNNSCIKNSLNKENDTYNNCNKINNLNSNELKLNDISRVNSPTVFTSSNSLKEITVNPNNCYNIKKSYSESISVKNGNMFSSGVFFLMLALAIHGFFEGVIVGTCTSVMSVWMTSFVILGHKWAESFALMSQFIFQNLKKKDKIILMSVFVLSSPVGIAAGIGFCDVKLYSGIFNGIGAGTVIFVASEITLDLFAEGGKFRFLKFVFYLFGSLFVFCLTMIERYTESKI